MYTWTASVLLFSGRRPLTALNGRRQRFTGKYRHGCVLVIVSFLQVLFDVRHHLLVRYTSAAIWNSQIDYGDKESGERRESHMARALTGFEIQ